MNPLLIKALAAWVVIAVFGWLCYDYGHDSVMSDWQQERSKMASATSKAMIALQQQRDATEQALKAKESQAWGMYQDAENKANELAGELNGMAWRVRVNTSPADCRVPETATTASVGNVSANEYAELPAETTRSVIAIGKDADQCEAKLKALQEYVKIIVDRK